MSLEKDILGVLQQVADLPAEKRERLIGAFRAAADVALQRSGDLPEEIALAIRDLMLKAMFAYVLGGKEKFTRILARVGQDARAASVLQAFVAPVTKMLPPTEGGT